MPLKLEKSDRRLLLGAAVVLAPVILATVLLTSTEQDSGIPSSYSAQSRGAKGAYLLLGELGYRVERWQRPPSDLPVEATHCTLVLALPLQPPSKEDKDAIGLFLSRGGRILATGSTSGQFIPQAETERELLVMPAGNLYQPQLVTALTHGGAIRMSPEAYWKKSSTDYLVHYADAGRPIVVSYKVGKGEVIWWASSMPLSNAEAAQAGNLALLLGSVGDPGNTQVFWDEYFHTPRSFTAYLGTRPIFFALLQGGIVFLALLLTYSRRNGPIYPPNEPPRLSPLEFVETLGGLYRQAKATRVALEVPYTSFRMLATRQLGLKRNIAAVDLARTVQNRLGYKDDHLKDLLQAIEHALHDPDLQEGRALELAQQLSFHTQSLQHIRSQAQ